MIMAILLKHLIVITQECENYWGPTKYNLQKLTELQVIQGFLPARIWQKQHKYYVYIKSRKQGITWGTKLREKLIEATHSLWLKQNLFEYNRKLHGLQEVEDI